MNGQTLVASTGFTTALFDPANLLGEPYYERQTAGFVNAVAVSPDGVTVAYGDGDSNIILWNIQTGAEVSLRGHTNSVQGLGFSPDGTRLVSASWDSTVRIWDVATGKELAFFTDFQSFAYAAAFSLGGQVIAAVGQLYPNAGLRRWNAQTFEELPLLSTENSLACLAFSADGRLLVAGEEWNTRFYVWDAHTFDRVALLGQTSSDPQGGTCAVAFSPDSTLLATGGGDKLIHIWDVAANSPTFGQELTTLRRHTDTIIALAFSPDGSLLASGGGHNDSTIRLWGINTGAPPVSGGPSDSTAPVETPIPAQTGTVSQNADLRVGPGTDYAGIGTISPGVSFTIDGRNAAGDWLHIRIMGGGIEVQAWLAASLVTTTVPIEALPVMGGAAT